MASFYELICRGNSLADVLLAPTRNSNSLKPIRIESRRRFHDSTNENLADIYRAVYALTHASDLVFHNTTHSKLPPTELQDLVQAVLAETWLDDESQWLLTQADEVLQTMTPDSLE